jgi:hypothetical protein
MTEAQILYTLLFSNIAAEFRTVAMFTVIIIIHTHAKLRISNSNRTLIIDVNVNHTSQFT